MSADEIVVIGSGPNGLAAAIRMAQAGRRVTLYEAMPTAGGCSRSAELTLPGFTHDTGAAVFPLAQASPFFRQLGLAECGLRWVEPPFPLAHPLDEGRAAILSRSIAETATSLGSDHDVYIELLHPLVEDAAALTADLLAPPGGQRHLWALARFAQHAVRSATGFSASHFHGDEARALLAGSAAHSFLPLEAPLTAGYGLFLTLLGHAVGWPVVQGGAGNLTTALVSTFLALGGTLRTADRVRTLNDLPPTATCFFDTDPLQLADIASSRLPAAFRRRLRRHRFGSGVFKLDYALDGPVPWTSEACSLAGTVHVGGGLEEIAQAEREVTRGRHPDRPFVIVSQPSLFDSTRAPAGKETLWAYCHVPAGSTLDMTDRVERQIERFAPGFRERILARHVMRSHDLHEWNPNLVGGAINGGLQDWRTYFTWSLARPSPYATPDPAIVRCSAATPPGGGVHGMAGFHAAEFVLRRDRKRGGRAFL